MDILVWYKEYVDINSNSALNKSYWINSEWLNSEWIQGTIIKVENNFGTLKPDKDSKTISIPPSMMSNNNIKVNDRIQVTTNLIGTKILVDLIKKI